MLPLRPRFGKQEKCRCGVLTCPADATPRRHPRVTASPLSLEVRALASLEGWPQAPSPPPSFEARQRGEHLRMTSEVLSGCKILFDFKNQTHVRDLAAGGARGLRFVVPQTGGSRECRMRAAPAVSCAKALKKAHTSIQGSGEHPTFPAQWLYGLYRAHPGVSGVLAPVASRKLALGPGRAFAPPKDLTPTIEASDPHDFAVRCRLRQRLRRAWYPSAEALAKAGSAPLVDTSCDRSRSLSRPAIPSRARCRRVHRIPSQRSVTMANAPSSGTGWREF